MYPLVILAAMFLQAEDVVFQMARQREENLNDRSAGEKVKPKTS